MYLITTDRLKRMSEYSSYLNKEMDKYSKFNDNFFATYTNRFKNSDEKLYLRVPGETVGCIDVSVNDKELSIKNIYINNSAINLVYKPEVKEIVNDFIDEKIYFLNLDSIKKTVKRNGLFIIENIVNEKERDYILNILKNHLKEVLINIYENKIIIKK